MLIAPLTLGSVSVGALLLGSLNPEVNEDGLVVLRAAASSMAQAEIIHKRLPTPNLVSLIYLKKPCVMYST